MTLEENNSVKNINNAVRVIKKTYANIEKFMISLYATIQRKGYVNTFSYGGRWYHLLTNTADSSWCDTSMIMLLQKNPDLVGKTYTLRQGPIYAIEVNIDIDAEEDDICIPYVYTGKFIFDNMDDWLKLKYVPKTESYEKFYNPLHGKDGFEHSSDDGHIIKISHEKMGNNDFYKGLSSAYFIKRELLSITEKNYTDVIDDIEKLATLS